MALPPFRATAGRRIATTARRSHLSSRATSRSLDHSKPPPAAAVASPHAFHNLLKSLTAASSLRRRGVGAVLSLLARARAARVPLLPASHLLAAAALLRHGRHADAFAHFNHLAAARDGANAAVLPSPLCNSLLAALCASGSLAAARKVFDKMLERGIEFSTLGFGVFTKNLCRSEELYCILGFVDEVKRREDRINRSVVAAVVIDGLCRAERIDDAWRALEELRLRGCKPDFIAYRIASEGFRTAGRAEEEGRILKQKRKLGVAPRMDDYKEFILELVSERRILEAKEIAEAIVSGDFPIDNDVLNMLIGSVSTVDPDAAIMFCKFMIGKERFPDAKMLSYLCRNLCKNAKGDAMWGIFRVLLDKGYCTNAGEYHLVVSFLCKAGKVREAYEVLKEMKRKRLDPDISSYNSLMEALCRNELLRPAKKLWDEMFTSGCSANLQTYNVLIAKFAAIGELEEARQLFDHMSHRGVAPDAVTYSSLINMLCHAKKFEQAVEIFSKSAQQDAGLAGLVLGTFVFALCEEGNFRKAMGVISSTPPGVQNSNSHVILLKSLTHSGQVDMAVEHIKWIRSNSNSALEKVMCELIASLSTAPSLEPVANLTQALHSQGLAHEVGPWMDMIGGV